VKRIWELDELVEHFNFQPNEMQQVGNKSGATRLGFAVLFKFFQYEALFPSRRIEVPKPVIQYIAEQVDVPAEMFAQYDLAGRAITYHRVQIRAFFDFRENTTADADEKIEWLCKTFYYKIIIPSI